LESSNDDIPERVVRSTSCLVLGCGFRGRRNEWHISGSIKSKLAISHDMTWHDRWYRQEPSDAAYCPITSVLFCHI